MYIIVQYTPTIVHSFKRCIHCTTVQCTHSTNCICFICTKIAYCIYAYLACWKPQRVIHLSYVRRINCHVCELINWIVSSEIYQYSRCSRILSFLYFIYNCRLCLKDIFTRHSNNAVCNNKCQESFHCVENRNFCQKCHLSIEKKWNFA